MVCYIGAGLNRVRSVCWSILGAFPPIMCSECVSFYQCRSSCHLCLSPRWCVLSDQFVLPICYVSDWCVFGPMMFGCCEMPSVGYACFYVRPIQLWFMIGISPFCCASPNAYWCWFMFCVCVSLCSTHPVFLFPCQIYVFDCNFSVFPSWCFFALFYWPINVFQKRLDGSCPSLWH